MKSRTTERALVLMALLTTACADEPGALESGADGAQSPAPSDESDELPSATSGDATATPTTAATSTAPPVDSDGGREDDGDPPPDTEQGGDCTDQLILDLGLVDGAVSTGGIMSVPDEAGWQSTIDATAGGIANAPQNPWIYLQFTDRGLQKLEIDDLQALDSDQWHLAAKRFGLRLNGGSSGPSTVAAAAVANATYEQLEAVPEELSLVEESFYDQTCSLVDDGTGQGAPNYALSAWWEYPGCVATTATPFVVGLPNDRYVKLVVDAYYQSGQAGCNDGGTMGMGSGNFTIRWAFIE